MSNNAVGNVYQTIIEEVINSSRVDFEENGIEESVLEELRQGWQQKLSQLDVARFPWDPKPDAPAAQPAQAAATTAPPAPAAAPAPTPVAVPPVPAAAPSHSQAQFSPQLPQPAAADVSASAPNGIKAEPTDEPQIKQEPGVTPMPPPGNFNGMDNKNSVAANRAAQLVQQQYGERAVGSINAIQAQQGGQQSQQPGAGGQSNVQNAQTDGAGEMDADDFEAVLISRNQAGEFEELGRVDIDKMLHDQIAAKAKSMEGGGLMLPLKEATRNKTMPNANRKDKGISGGDAADDEPYEDPDDAINSDLDDPDEDRSDDDVEDEGLGHIMLCMYDKVQRVKNKWKCTLKDGVLTVNGKEYVFHKATGEYEW